jgi:RNA polymerase sigma-70 factor (ECF subfamily)
MYRQRVFRTIVSITMNREDAEDALQQTFLQAFQALHRFEFRSSFYSWITRIAINSSLVILRRRRNQSQIACTRWSDVEDGTWIENVPDAAPNPEQVYERAQQAQRLSVALKKLRPNERLIMELHLAEDLSIHDLAESLHISESAAKVRLYRARKKVVSDFKSQPTGRSRSSPISAR